MDLGVKCQKSGKNQFFVFVQITGKKVYETGVLGEEKGKTGAETAFFVQVGQISHNTDIQCVM